MRTKLYNIYLQGSKDGQPIPGYIAGPLMVNLPNHKALAVYLETLSVEIKAGYVPRELEDALCEGPSWLLGCSDRGLDEIIAERGV